MATLSPTVAKGQPYFEGDSTFDDHNDQADRKVGGTYSHNEYELSGTTCDRWQSWMMYVNQMLASGGTAHKVRNQTGGALTKGRLVYASGYASSRILITKADGDSPATAAVMVLAEDLADTTNGVAYTFNTVTGTVGEPLDTSGASAIGDKVYLDTSTAGDFVYTAPTGADQIAQEVGIVAVKDATTGSIIFYPGMMYLQAVGTSFIQNDAVTAAKVASAVANAQEVPRWFKFNVAYSDLAAASTTNDIELLSLPARGVIQAVIIKHSTAFSGGGITAYTVSVGISGNLTKYAAAFDVFQAVAATTFGEDEIFGTENFGSATSIRIAATSTTADLDQATAGVVDVWVLVGGLTAP